MALMIQIRIDEISRMKKNEEWGRAQMGSGRTKKPGN